MGEMIENINEIELILRAQKHDREAMDFLLKKYNPLVKKISRAYYLIGGDQEDLIQEGMIGLFNALSDYKADAGASFATFASMCVERKIQSAVAASNRKKNTPLNESLSFDQTEDENIGFDLSTSEDESPENKLLYKEREDTLMHAVDTELSAFEREVFMMYVEGKSYQEIGLKLGKTSKAADNAVQRIRKKLRAFF